VCLPFLGAGASFFYPWYEKGRKEIEVVAIRLPGRESRVDEEPYRDVNTAVDDEGAVDVPVMASPSTVRDFSDDLLAVWTAAFGKGAKLDDDFFELGGNSLYAVQLAAVKCERGWPRIPVREIYRNPAVRQLASCLHGTPNRPGSRTQARREPGALLKGCSFLRGLFRQGQIWQ
jgi:hypothetical protein